MSQTAQTCTQCGMLIEPGQRFCASCGAPAPQSTGTTTSAPTYASPPSNPGYPGGGIAPTVSASSPSNPNNPSYPDYLSTPAANPYPETPSYLSEGAQPGSSSPYTQYPTPAPPPPTAPSLPYYTPPASTSKQRPPWFMPVVILVALVVVIGGGVGIWKLSGSGGSTGGGGNGTPGANGTNYPASQNLNLNATYSSVQMTFTSLQQASKFADDTYTSMYGAKKNWVRLNFKENLDQADASYGANYGYSEAFTLVLPDGSTAAATSSKDYTGPQAGVSRTEWVDFGLSQQVDLSNLKLRLGAASEAQMEFSLKNNADLSKYQPKTQTPNKPFLYASVNWTLNSISQSYYYGGAQAKKGDVIIVVSLTASNNTSDYIFLDYNSIRLKAGDTTAAPADSSDLSKLDSFEPNTTNVKGTAAFEVTQTSNNQYTLVFPASSQGKYSEVDEAITIS